MISRRLIVNVALTIADSVWAYLALAVIGLVLAQDRAPLAWPLIMLLLTLGVATRALGESRTARAVAMGAAAVAVYAAAASSSVFDTWELAWPLYLVQGHYAMLDVAGITLALLGAAWSWRRGMTLATEEFLEARTGRVFRTGLVMLSFAFLLEVITGRELGAASGLLPFFLASLAAMALARMPDVTQASRSWVIIVATTVVLAIGLGLLAGVIFGAAGRGGVTLVSTGWSQIAEFVVTVVAMVIITIMTVILSVGSWFGTADNHNGTLKPIFEIPEWLTQTQQDAMGGPHGPPEVWPYLVAIVVCYLLYRMLIPPLKRRFRRPPLEAAHREILDTETRPINDLGRLLKILFGAGGGRQVQPGCVIHAKNRVLPRYSSFTSRCWTRPCAGESSCPAPPPRWSRWRRSWPHCRTPR